MVDKLNMDNLVKPLIIRSEGAVLHGILRGDAKGEDLFIFIPAATGTRIGPQRIFVELSQSLRKYGKSSFCVDLPPLGDSYDKNPIRHQGLYSEFLTRQFRKYLQIIVEFFNSNYGFVNIKLVSISDGCLPVYRFAQKYKISDIIMLSPNHLLDEIQHINTKNLRAYLLKITSVNTWKKLMSLNLDIKSIYRNIFRPGTGKQPSKQIVRYTSYPIGNCLVVFGEKEERLQTYKDYWDREYKAGKIKKLQFELIKGADHSYFGWGFKRDVEAAINKFSF